MIHAYMIQTQDDTYVYRLIYSPHPHPQIFSSYDQQLLESKHTTHFVYTTNLPPDIIRLLHIYLTSKSNKSTNSLPHPAFLKLKPTCGVEAAPPLPSPCQPTQPHPTPL